MFMSIYCFISILCFTPVCCFMLHYCFTLARVLIFHSLSREAVPGFLYVGTIVYSVQCTLYTVHCTALTYTVYSCIVLFHSLLPAVLTGGSSAPIPHRTLQTINPSAQCFNTCGKHFFHCASRHSKWRISYATIISALKILHMKIW